MIELMFTGHSIGNYRGMLGADINASDAITMIACEISPGNNESETLELTIDENGNFSIVVDSQPISLFVDGNLLIEAKDFNNLQPLEYIWNPITKILTGKVPI